jgi:zinc/manganese transport system ATP-binding protein
MSGAALAFDDLTLGYEGHPAVHHLSGSFAAGSLSAIVGPNGSGKSTLCKGIMGLLRPIGGHIERAHAGPGAIAYLPQAAEIDRSFPTPVADLVALGLWARRGPFGRIGPADATRLGEALAAVGLEGFAGRALDTLSGGQMQRALFARVLLQDAPVVLLDEPFAAVDEATATDLAGLLAHWQSEGRTVIAVLHDIAMVRRNFPQTLLLAREPIAWGATAEVLTPQNLGRARGMTQAWDEHAPWHEADGGHGHPEAAE